MIRNAKKSKPLNEVFDKLIEVFDLSTNEVLCKYKMDVRPDGLTSIFTCCTTCTIKCDKFVTLEWVIDSCMDSECGYEHPCDKCVIQIHSAKKVVPIMTMYYADTIGSYKIEQSLKGRTSKSNYSLGKSKRKNKW